jgi:N-acetylneuraminic acid mutarotase
MIVWGGYNLRSVNYLNTGGRYNPITDSWVATTTTNAPDARLGHSAVWTGTEMIVWGGDSCAFFPCHDVKTGGRYNPSTDSWLYTNQNGAPDERERHAAVWTGSEMIVWGGFNDTPPYNLNTGGRYNPGTDSWIPTNTNGAPDGGGGTGIWTGSEMLVWTGSEKLGGRYNPSTDSWLAINTTGAPEERGNYATVWTGSEMIIWGGNQSISPFIDLNTGARYNPSTDVWVDTTTTGAPDGRENVTGVWTGSEMIVWSGFNNSQRPPLSTGGRYCAQAASPTPTPTPEPITLSAKKKKVQGINTVRLTWSGATSANMEVYRNGVVVATTANDGSYDDSTGDSGQAQYTYKVCEAGTQTCSSDVLVTFPR